MATLTYRLGPCNQTLTWGPTYSTRLTPPTNAGSSVGEVWSQTDPNSVSNRTKLEVLVSVWPFLWETERFGFQFGKFASLLNGFKLGLNQTDLVNLKVIRSLRKFN